MLSLRVKCNLYVLFVLCAVDNHWVVDTDYDNYAIVYSCREMGDNGDCLDDYSFIFSRNQNGLTPEAQRNVRRKQSELCLDRKYRIVPQNGKNNLTINIFF